MDAWILDESPGTYRRGSIELPGPATGEVQVRPVTSALNHMDLWVMSGQPRPHLPHVPGCDVAGVVEAVGPGVDGIAIGDEVVINPAVSSVADIVAYGNDAPLGRSLQILGEQRWGGHAEGVVVPARNIVAKPAMVGWEEAAAYPLCHLTAWRMLRRARLRAGETLLVVGIGGGVASAALALGAHLGARVFVTSTSDTKLTRATDLGAEGGFRSDADWPVRADVVVESVGPATWDRSVKALKPGGRMVVCGGTSGQDVTLSLPRLFFKQFEIIGSTMGSYEEFAQVTAMVEQGLAVVVDEVLGIDEYPAALERLRAGQQLGKIVLRHSESVS
ncbi:MAG TPA: zinc-binding dehydrogenase [Acidimicrobiales bacterium]|jgi:NADPH:quinone reductase-like Zn-dependent oxidoreductase|nr:zinc-binding dehydrogenase [Acidimicrobiales bacterium]